MADVLPSGGVLLILAPHPDDESLGCGGLLAELWRGGGRAHVACLTDGEASHPRSRQHPAAALAELRRNELNTAVRILGGRTSDITFLGFPDAAVHRVHGPGQDPVRALAGIVDTVGASTILAPSPLDPHCDHETGAAVARKVALSRPSLALWYYPVWSAWQSREGTLPLPAGTRPVRRNHHYRDVKYAAIAAHRSQSGQVVKDDPDGFTMPAGFAEYFANRQETFLEVAS